MQPITAIANTRILNRHPVFPTGAHLNKPLRLRRNILKPDPAPLTRLRHLPQIVLLATRILLKRIMATATQSALAVAAPPALAATTGFTILHVQNT